MKNSSIKSLESNSIYSRATECLSALLDYLKTWQNDDGLFGGIIATWWSSTLETALPHPMNQFPLILGFIELNRKRTDCTWLKEARRVGDGLLASILPNGMLKNCWGDIPGKSTGTVIYACPALALAELSVATKDERYLDGAARLLNTIATRWSHNGLNTDGVANQGLKWAEALVAFGRAASDKTYLGQAIKIGSSILNQQISKGLQRGGIYQSRTDDRLISVYQGKCLAPLIRLYEETGDGKFIRAACKLADYIIGSKSKNGIFLNYRAPQGWWYSATSAIPRRMDWRVFHRSVPTYRIWRCIKVQWDTIFYPSFIARSGDSIRGLWLLSKHRPEYKHIARHLSKRLMSFQLSNGGFPNTVGFTGHSDDIAWQDACAPTRWNAYVFQLLTTILSDSDGSLATIEKRTCDHEFCVTTGQSRDIIFCETASKVILKQYGKVFAEILKPNGITKKIDKEWQGDLSGARDCSNMCKHKR